MNHESETAQLVQDEFPPSQVQSSLRQQPSVVSMNKLLLMNTSQAFTPGLMLAKQIVVFSSAIRKSINQYNNKQSGSFSNNLAESMQEYDGVSYSNDTLRADNSFTAKSIKAIGKIFGKVGSLFRSNKQQQQQQIRNESLIAEHSQRIDEEQHV